MNDHLTRTILFVRLHGSAKSLIAAEHLNRMAESRSQRLRAESAGIEPDPAVPAPVVFGLAGDGFDVRGYLPRQFNSAMLESVHLLVLCGCDMPAFVPPATRVERWDDLPMVSDGYGRARDALVSRLEQLLHHCM